MQTTPVILFAALLQAYGQCKMANERTTSLKETLVMFMYVQ